jgi:hypothetical protein
VRMRGRKRVAKRVLVQAAAFNLALILRSITKAGTPRGLADLKIKLFSALCRVQAALPTLSAPTTSLAFGFSPIRPLAKLGSRVSEVSDGRKWVF